MSCELAQARPFFHTFDATPTRNQMFSKPCVTPKTPIVGFRVSKYWREGEPNVGGRGFLNMPVGFIYWRKGIFQFAGGFSYWRVGFHFLAQGFSKLAEEGSLSWLVPHLLTVFSSVHVK